MPVKERLSGVRLYTLTPLKLSTTRVTLQEDTLSSKPFIIPKRKSAQTKFTGRQRELDYMRTLYNEVIVRLKKQNSGKEINHKPIIAAIKGEAGIGKSRLVKEFINRIRNNTEAKHENVLYGYCQSAGQNSFGLFSDILKNSAEKKIRLKNSAEQSDANNIRIQNSIKELLFNAAYNLNKQNIPLVIMLEDMQWADESSLAALEHIIKSINLYTDKNQPQILFILNYRNKFKPSKVLRAECDYREIELEGFTEKETESLISGLTGNKTVSGKAKEIITSRSDGNPFNVEEWCSLFNEKKALSQIPQSVRALLVEKVANLGSSERGVLITASVLGKKFELKILNEILKRAGREQGSSPIMKSLIEKRFLVNLSGDVYEFRHDILQETIYSRLTPNVKQDVHLLAGNTIEALFPNRLRDYYYELARHYTEAKSEAKSIEYLEKAGDKAKNNYEHERALRYYERLIKSYDTIQVCKKIRILLLLGEIKKRIGMYEDAMNYYLQALRIQQKFENRRNINEVFINLAELHILLGNYSKAIPYLKPYIKNYSYNDDIINARQYIARGNIYKENGKINKSIMVYYKGYNIAKLIKDPETIIKSAGSLGILYRTIGKYIKAEKFLSIAINSAKIFKNKSASADFLNSLGGVYYYKGNYTQALNNFRESLRINETIGNYKGMIASTSNLATIQILLQNYKEAESRLIKLIRICQNYNDILTLIGVYNNLGVLHQQKGNFIKAIECYEKNLEYNRKLKRIQGISESYGNLGIIYQYIGKNDEAILYLLKQYKLDNKIGNIEGMIKSLINIGSVKYSDKKYDEAVKVTIKAVKLAKKVGSNRPLMLGYSNLSEYFFEKQDYVKALYYVDQFYENYNSVFKEDEFNIILIKEKITANNTIKIFREGKISANDLAKSIGALIARLSKMHKIAKDNKQEAQYFFVLWKLCEEVNSLKMKIFCYKNYKHLAIKAYMNLYKLDPRESYKKIINEATKKL